ncbi:MAG: RHS repeat-associated core domain-containing protein [Chthoniobacteraceae bacterium]
MKMRVYIFLVTVYIMFLSGYVCQGQTLSEVLNAVQNREQLLHDQSNISIRLQNRANQYQGSSSTQPESPFQPFAWNIVSANPTEEEVDSLSVAEQISLLREAKNELRKIIVKFDDPRMSDKHCGVESQFTSFGNHGVPSELDQFVTVENFHQQLASMATCLRQMQMLAWPAISIDESNLKSTYVDAGQIPSGLPLKRDFLNPSGDEWPTYKSSFRQGCSFGFNGTIDATNGGNVNANTFGYFPLESNGADSVAGTVLMYYSSPCYLINELRGLTWVGIGGDGTSQTMYHPGDQLLAQVLTDKEQSVSLSDVGLFGGTLSISGTWQSMSISPNSYELFVPDVPDENGQTNEALWQSYIDVNSTSYDRNSYELLCFNDVSWGTHDDAPEYLDLVLGWNARYQADFEQEFSGDDTHIPVQPKPLSIIPDFANERLVVKLDDSASNECELEFLFRNIVVSDQNGGTGAISNRNILSVSGNGKWDAVFSGKPEDREPRLDWNGVWNNKNGRWKTYNDYLTEWWRPELVQLKSASYLVNVTQLGDRFSYKIDFYRADQVQAKDSVTGRYSIKSGQGPIESWTVENPQHDDSKNGFLTITTSKGACNISLTQSSASTGGLIDHWAFAETDSASGNEVLHKSVDVTSAEKSANANNYTTITSPYTVADETSLNGVALPSITTTYWDTWANPQRIDQIVESGSDGTKTTTYTYDWEEDDDANTYLPDHLTQVQQSGGPNPYTAAYDGNELLTSWVSASSEVDYGYNGSQVTRTEKFNGSNVRQETTTWSGDMTTATTTVSGASDATNSIVQYNSGTDGTYPWGLKLVQGFDGSLTTYGYAANSDGSFTVTTMSGRSTTTNQAVGAGTKVVQTINSSGQLIASETDDIESGAKLDYATATEFQNTVFPKTFSCSLGTTEGYTYDGEGQVLSHTDRLGITSNYTLDALGRTTEVARNGVTLDIGYNPGHLGRLLTWKATGEDNRTQEETVSPFGLSQTVAIVGPEHVTTTRTEDANTITLQTNNSTTGQNLTKTFTKATMATAITGNAMKPWNISYTFPGSGWKQTTTHGSDTALTEAVTLDALGRIISDVSPSPTGSGTATTTYGYTGGRLTSVLDPGGETDYSYQPDGSLQKTSRSGRYVSVNRVTSSSSQIKWEWKDATGETLWQRSYNPTTQATTEIPWGESARAVTTTPTISGSVLQLVASGPNLSATSQWKDGVPYQGSSTVGAPQTSWSATPNGFGEIASATVNVGAGTANSITTNYSNLGLPTDTSGLVNSHRVDSFDGTTGWTATVTQNGHTTTSKASLKGDALGAQGYGFADQTWSTPSYGSTITKTLGTGAGNAQFTWNLAGQLLQRKFPDGSAESFTYNAAGAPQSWTTPRASFSLAPNAFGEPTTLGGMGSIGYDLAGRVNSITDAAGSHTTTYTEGQPATEGHTSGVLSGQWVNHAYDSLGRLQKVTIWPGGKQTIYAYDDSGTGALYSITTMGGAGGTFTNYDSVTGRAKTVTLAGVLSVARSFDGLGRTLSENSTITGQTLTYNGYQYDADGHCYQLSTPQGSWTLGYDSNGYLQSVTGSKNDTFNLDEAGRSVGDITNDYFPVVRHNNSTVEVFGSVSPSATLKINNVTTTVDATTGKFDVTYTPTAGTWQAYDVVATLAGAGTGGAAAVAEQIKNVYVPSPNESLSFDGSGNLQGDERWTYTWSSLDQCTRWVEKNPLDAGSKTQVDCIYDLQGRRVQKQVTVGGVVSKRTTTLWDGWRPVLEVDYDAKNEETAKRYYTWGADVSGTMNGAAGIGGLIEVMETKGATTTKSLAIYDGIGNVVGLADETSGVQVAGYSYGPYGEVLSEWGERAESCPFRYQTKEYDVETGYYYFGKRDHDPKTRCWLSRDPEREAGGANLYAYCENQPVGNYDPIGLDIAFLPLPTTFYLPIFRTPFDKDEKLEQDRSDERSISQQNPQVSRMADQGIAGGVNELVRLRQLQAELEVRKSDGLPTDDLNSQFVNGINNLQDANALRALRTSINNRDQERLNEQVGLILMGFTAGRSIISGALGELSAAKSTMIATPSTNLRAIAAGVDSLNSAQAQVLEKLSGYGSSTIIPKRGFGQTDLAALSAATGDEFAMFTTGGRRLIMRGDSQTVPISPEQAQSLSEQGWRWSSHVHPDGVLRSSLGDRKVLGPFRNQRSAILDPFGGRSLFSPTGDMVSPSWLP